MPKGGDRVFKSKPITKVRKKIVQPTTTKKTVPTTARAKKIETSQQTIARLKKEYDVADVVMKVKKKSLLDKAKALFKSIKAQPKPKKQKKTTWPSGITSQKQFDELMNIKKKKKK